MFSIEVGRLGTLVEFRRPTRIEALKLADSIAIDLETTAVVRTSDGAEIYRVEVKETRP